MIKAKIDNIIASFSTEGAIKNIPNEKFDDEYSKVNLIAFKMYKVEYSFAKHLRKKTILRQIQSEEELIENIKNELIKYDFPQLGVKQFQYNELIALLANSLNEFDNKNNNKFNGYIELEQYHTIAIKINENIPEIMMKTLTKK
tara:strand:- start:2783 stop:3214 length:432 start_codon:yes stop_codon:yes gene_type:complete